MIGILDYGLGNLHSVNNALNYLGADSFTYQANDGEFDSNISTISITITPENDPPELELIDPQVIDEDETITQHESVIMDSIKFQITYLEGI